MLTAIILNYWKPRRKYLSKILETYDRYIIWNNDDEIIDGAINANKNYGPYIRFLVALLSDSEYVIFQDNDLLLERKTVNDMLEFNKMHPDALVGLWGKNLDNSQYPYTGNGQSNPTNPTLCGEMKEVDIIISRTLMMRRKLIPMILEFGLNFEPILRGCDIIASMANKNAGHKNFIIPGNAILLDEQGIGLWHEKDHFKLRDDLCIRINNFMDNKK